MPAIGAAFFRSAKSAGARTARVGGPGAGLSSAAPFRGWRREGFDTLAEIRTLPPDCSIYIF
jgi:hypothetical protein